MTALPVLQPDCSIRGPSCRNHWATTFHLKFITNDGHHKYGQTLEALTCIHVYIGIPLTQHPWHSFFSDTNWNSKSFEGRPNCVWVWRCVWWHGREKESRQCKTSREGQKGRFLARQNSLTNMDTIWTGPNCPCYRGVRLREVLVLERCPS